MIILESLKKDLTTLQVSKMEQDVQERARQVAARRYKAKVEDVTDYDDLEGQYRNRYDEDGNLIGVDEGGTGGRQRGVGGHISEQPASNIDAVTALLKIDQDAFCGGEHGRLKL